MTKEEATSVNHRIKNIAHIMMSLQHQFDKLVKEIDDGVVDNPNCNCARNGGRTNVQMDSSLSGSSIIYANGVKKERQEIEGVSSIPFSFDT